MTRPAATLRHPGERAERGNGRAIIVPSGRRATALDYLDNASTAFVVDKPHNSTATPLEVKGWHC